MIENFASRRLALAAALAGFMGLPGLARAQRHNEAHHEVHREFEHHGSIHWGVPEPHREFHVEHGGSIRYAPWARGPFLVAPRYAREYFRLFRPGYRTLWIGLNQFYYYAALPPDCGPTVINGQYYYVCGGVYYLPYLFEGATVYVVVPPPV